MELENNNVDASASEKVSSGDLEEIFEALKSKIFALKTNDPLRLRLLTLAPNSWSERKIASEFNVSRRLAHSSKILKSQQGIMGDTCAKRGKNLSQQTVDKVTAFFNDDDNSRIMASTKDVAAIIVDGEKVHLQKRLLLFSLKELHVIYQGMNPDNQVSFSLFAKLRPKNCILPGKSGTHATCVCVCHQNVKLMLEAINLKVLTENKTVKLTDYKDCVKMLVCENSNKKCYLNDCNECPGIENLRNYLSGILQEASIFQVKYASWTDTDRSTLLTVVSTVEEYVEELCEKMKKLKIHSYIAKNQTKFIKHKKENLSEGQVLVTFDFAENLTFAVQDASQAFHWNNDQCTVFPCIYYYKKDSKIVKKNCIFLSESRKHNTSAVYTIQKQLIAQIKKDIRKVKKIIYISDGAKQHFKNKYQMSNLKNHKRDFKISAEWHFSATAHGKCACDGLGASFKREVYRASLKMKATEALINMKAVLNWARKNYSGGEIFYFSQAEHDQNGRSLNARFKKAEALTGISMNHSFKISQDGSINMEILSKVIKKQ